MENCKHCGSPLPEDAAFCPKCGKPVEADDVSATPDSITTDASAPDLQTPADAVDHLNDPTTLDPDTPDASEFGAAAPAPTTPDSITPDASAPDLQTPAEAVDHLNAPETLDPDTPDASEYGAAAPRESSDPSPVADPSAAYDPFPTRQSVDASTFPVSEERVNDAWQGDETPNYASESSWDQTDAEYPPDAAPGSYERRSDDVPVQGMESTIFENNDRYSEFTPHNYIGLVGFIIACVAACTSWAWGFGWFVWLVGAVVSFVGVFFQPRGFAIAGLCISLAGLIILIAACSALLGAAAMLYGGVHIVG